MVEQLLGASNRGQAEEDSIPRNLSATYRAAHIAAYKATYIFTGDTKTSKTKKQKPFQKIVRCLLPDMEAGKCKRGHSNEP